MESPVIKLYISDALQSKESIKASAASSGTFLFKFVKIGMVESPFCKILKMLEPFSLKAKTRPYVRFEYLIFSYISLLISKTEWTRACDFCIGMTFRFDVHNKFICRICMNECFFEIVFQSFRNRYK